MKDNSEVRLSPKGGSLRIRIKSVTVTVLCAIITTVGIILIEYKFYAGILFVGIGVGLFAKQMKGLHRKIEEEIGG